MRVAETSKNTFLISAAAIAGLVKLLLLFIALFTGFEITDEGATFLSLAAPLNVYDELHLQFRFLWYPVLKFIPLTIFNVRLVTLLAELLCLAWLSYWLTKWVSFSSARFDFKWTFILFFSFSVLGINLGVNTYSAYYLHITNTLGYLLLGCIVGTLYLLKSEKSVTTIYVLCLLAGFITGIQWIVKFSSAVLFGLLVLVFLVGYLKSYRIAALLSWLTGLALFLAIYFLTVKSPPEYVEVAKAGNLMIQLQGYNVLDILRTNFTSDLWCYSVYALFFFVPFFIMCFAVKVEGGKAALVALAIQATILLIDNKFNLFGFFSGIHLKIIHPVFCFYIALLFSRYHSTSNSHSNNEEAFVWIALLIFPALAAAGTAIPLQMALLSYIAPVVAGLFWLIVKGYSKFVASLLVGCFSIVLIIQYSYLSFFNQRLPNGYLGNITQQNTYLPGEGVFVSNDAAAFFNGVNKVIRLNGYKENDEVVALTNMPGLVYYLKASSPATHWYFSDETTRVKGAGVKLNCFHLQKLSAAKSRYLFILEKTDAAMLSCLPVSPDNCKLLATIYNPYFNRNMNIYLQPAYAQ